MKYCPNCGRQLQDNEVCTCQTQNAQQQNTQAQPQFNQVNAQNAQPQFNQANVQNAQPQFNQANVQNAQPQFNQANVQYAQPQFNKPQSPLQASLVDLCKNIFVRPYDAILNFLKMGSVGGAYIVLIATAILGFFNVLFDEIQSSMRYAYSEFNWTDVFKSSAIDLLDCLAVASIGALVIVCLTNAFDKKYNNRIDFKQAITIYAISEIAYEVIRIVANLFEFFDVKFFDYISDVISRFGAGYEIMLVGLCITVFVKDKNKLPFTLGLAYAASKVASILINLLFNM